MGNYTDGGGDMSRYTYGTYAYQGSCAADIQDNSGTASSFYHTTGYNVSGYSDLEVDFYFVAVGMEYNEDFWVQYYNGSTWQTVASFASGTDFSNNTFYHVTVTIPKSQYTYPTNARLRFMCDASSNTDDVYIDAIEFRGMGASGSGAAAKAGTLIPEEFALSQNYPNPFNPTTTIQFSLPSAGNVNLEVYNVLGQRVATLVDEALEAGVHTVRWDASNQSSGIYLYRIKASEFVETKKMMLIK
nr:T9SS type A sorting domain-containing protein [candidate division Zixibacteria bacterium]